jgi:hypothetical protein
MEIESKGMAFGYTMEIPVLKPLTAALIVIKKQNSLLMEGRKLCLDVAVVFLY